MNFEKYFFVSRNNWNWENQLNWRKITKFSTRNVKVEKTHEKLLGVAGKHSWHHMFILFFVLCCQPRNVRRKNRERRLKKCVALTERAKVSERERENKGKPHQHRRNSNNVYSFQCLFFVLRDLMALLLFTFELFHSEIVFSSRN
jgi:hypothetical protein